MLIDRSILKTDLEPIEAGDTAREVIGQMEGLEVTTLPVIDKTTRKLIGRVEYEELAKVGEDTRISDIEVEQTIKIYEGQHIFEAARLMLQYELYLLPLVDKELTYLGLLTERQVFEAVCRMLNLVESGSVVTIELEPIDFSISEIVQIIETEGAKILGITVEGPEEGKKFQISIKLNLNDISRVTAALKRYDYSVIVESESTVFKNDLEDRADELLKYMDM